MMSATSVSRPDIVIASENYIIRDTCLEKDFSFNAGLDMLWKEKFNRCILFVPTISLVQQYYYWYLNNKSRSSFVIVPLSSEHRNFIREIDYNRLMGKKLVVVATSIAQ